MASKIVSIQEIINKQLNHFRSDTGGTMPTIFSTPKGISALVGTSSSRDPSSSMDLCTYRGKL